MAKQLRSDLHQSNFDHYSSSLVDETKFHKWKPPLESEEIFFCSALLRIPIDGESLGQRISKYLDTLKQVIEYITMLPSKRPLNGVPRNSKKNVYSKNFQDCFPNIFH